MVVDDAARLERKLGAAVSKCLSAGDGGRRKLEKDLVRRREAGKKAAQPTSSKQGRSYRVVGCCGVKVWVDTSQKAGGSRIVNGRFG